MEPRSCYCVQIRSEHLSCSSYMTLYHSCFNIYNYSVDREVISSSSGDTVLVTVIVLLSVSILSSILFYAIGTVSGCFCRRCKCKQPIDGTSSQPAPLYDSVHVIQQDTDKKNIELRENVAYGRIWWWILFLVFVLVDWENTVSERQWLFNVVYYDQRCIWLIIIMHQWPYILSIARYRLGLFAKQMVIILLWSVLFNK